MDKIELENKAEKAPKVTKKQKEFVSELAQMVIEKHGTITVGFADNMYVVISQSGEVRAKSFNFLSALLMLLVKDTQK